jgi:hypothetical protein
MIDVQSNEHSNGNLKLKASETLTEADRHNVPQVRKWLSS